MPVLLAYIAVVIVWSTTPLGVKWSGDGLSPVMGAFARIALAAAAAWVIARVMGIRVPWNKQAVKAYLYANIGWSGGLIAVYIAATELTSGLISVIFGLSPIVSALVARYLLPDTTFGPLQWLAACLGLAGLAVVFQGELVQAGDHYGAVLLVLWAVFCFCLSSVLIKRLDAGLHPLSQTAGSLVCALPVYGSAALVLSDGHFEPTYKALGAIVYLGLVGSLVGFLCYFYILKKLPPTTVALVPLLTPVFALMLGNWLNDEVITEALLTGAGCILAGLVLFQWPYKPAKGAAT
ncbi:MAG: DMT family transporter [Ketobacteraceae bacterium]|nr:DMT family transporter [Ketobacteraceae bacterium]